MSFMILGTNRHAPRQIEIPIDNYADQLVWYMEKYLDKIKIDTESFSIKASKKAKIGLRWIVFPNDKEFERDYQRHRDDFGNKTWSIISHYTRCIMQLVGQLAECIMKKVIYLLVLCMVLGMAGCGTNQENKEPVSGNVSVETENKENDDVVQNEQIADTGSYPPCVMVDGVIYKDTGYVASMPGCGTMDGEIVSTVAGTELPSENNQSNFGSGYHYQRSSEGQLIVVIDDERIIFRDIEKDDTSIPIEVINFNAKVKEITDDGELLVTHVSTAEGFCQMNDGEYYVSAENLAEDVQVGDIVTIWFNGMIQETYPAQLGVVYRIIKTQ